MIQRLLDDDASAGLPCFARLLFERGYEVSVRRVLITGGNIEFRNAERILDMGGRVTLKRGRDCARCAVRERVRDGIIPDTRVNGLGLIKFAASQDYSRYA